MSGTFLNLALWARMSLVGVSSWISLKSAAASPQRTQNRLLQRILKSQRTTEFGREHGFERINDVSQFQQQVPIQDYESLRRYIRKQEQQGTPALNTHPPIMYAQTSGTTDKPKLIPILSSTIKQYRQTQRLSAWAIYSKIPGSYSGKILAVSSPATEGILKSGTPYGSISGLVYQSMPTMMRKKYVLPASTFSIADYEEKYFDIAKRGMLEKGVTLLAAANPSTLLKILDVMNEHASGLIEEIRLENSARANELESIWQDHGKISFDQLWPQLKAVVTWTGGSCGAMIPSLSKSLGAHTRIVELGYLSSEFRGTITIDAKNNLQMPCITQHYYEFIRKEDIELETAPIKQLHEIEFGEQYYVLVTTDNGLYRYHINDLIEVTGHYRRTPTIRFVQKGKGTTNLTGEKLYENHVVQAVSELLDGCSEQAPFFIMLASPETMGYCLYIEAANPDASQLDQILGQINIEFKEKLRSGRLAKSRVVELARGTAEKYKLHCLQHGQREGQFKISYLQSTGDCTFDFDAHRPGSL